MEKTKDFIKRFTKLICIFSLFFLASLFQLIPVYIFDLDLETLTATQSVLLTIFSDLILVIILAIIYRKSLKEDFVKLKNNFYYHIDTGTKYWFIGLIVMVVSNLIITFFISGAQAGNEESVQELIKGSGFLSIIAVGILAPIAEELTFRKGFRECFKNKWLFIIISSLVFGGLHVVLSLNSIWDLFYLIPYSSLGVAFAYMYAKTDNIYTSIIMHMFHNTALTLLSVLGTMMIL